jgi:hypothetical protein
VIDIDIIPRAQWGAPPAHAPFIHMPSDHLWLHHTAGPQEGYWGMRELRRYTMNEGYDDIPYSFVVDPEGLIFEARGAGRDSGATGGDNSNSHAICIMGNYHIRPVPWAAKEATARLSAYGFQRGWWRTPTLTGGHRDVRGTTVCPGNYAYASIPEINSMATKILAADSLPPFIPVIKVATQTGGKELDMNKIKGKIITTKHIGLGQHVGVWDAGIGNLVECQATIHGPAPKQAGGTDSLWEPSIGATVRAQCRGPKVVVTVSTPKWKIGDAPVAVHVLAMV